MTGGEGEALHDNSTTSAVVSYSELLFSGDDDINNHLGLSFISPAADIPPKMLCFGDSVDIYSLQYHKNASSSIKMEQNTDVLTCISHSSSKKRDAEGKATFGEDGGDIMKKWEDGGPEVGNKRNRNSSKKTKCGANNNSLQNRHAKVKKVKLGERIVALQQLVSPFGKTDTASVLHEAKGYITFLQEQVQLLCSPYLQLIHHEGRERVRNEEEVKSRKDLRSKGLCVVPIGITSLHVTDDNGADYWSPANALVNPSSS